MARYNGTGKLTVKQSLYTNTFFTTWTTRQLAGDFDGQHTRQTFSERVARALREAPVRNLDIRSPRV